ncbi:hypothetical protein K4H28_14545 [Deefgea tanakiae]|uniref:Uncharacterized protein n=1 Tax=Deefgea tanakiae TaxID=2865840 RepID=A0ABX8Z8R1_9NEIS|nr:hypothetical protein [Deefgea tanakiae]QZA77483.1 hypothetical protein K4H28_14545 [Deefgea tanakiae]
MIESPNLSFYALRQLGQGQYRIIWYGNIIDGLRGTLITVVFAPYIQSAGSSEMKCDFTNRIPIRLPVAFLRRFRIGDIWENQQWTGQVDTQTQETFNLQVTSDSICVLPIGAPLEKNSNHPQYLLPFDLFEGHREHTQTHCLRFDLDDGAILVVPCMELIRFYFGSSGSFLKRIFSGAFALDQLFQNAKLNKRTGTANIALAADLSGVAAATVARIAFCKQAKNAARWIVNSHVASLVNKQSYYPKTSFPFFGSTDLTTRGRWLVTDTSRVFLVEQLTSCTHPFPFQSLYYTSSKSLSIPNDPLKRDNTANDDPADHNAQKIELSDSQVSNLLAYLGLTEAYEGRPSFPDLVNKHILRTNKQQQGTKAPGCSNIQELGAGPSTSTVDLRGAELVSDLSDVISALPETPRIVTQAIKAYQVIEKLHLTWQPFPGQDESTAKLIRGDTLFKTDIVPKLQKIWAGILKVNINGIIASALILMRDHITEDADDHIIAVRLAANYIDTEIEEFCLAYANRTQSSNFNDRIVCMIESAGATSILDVLHRLIWINGPLFGQRPLRKGETDLLRKIVKRSKEPY